MKIRFYAYLLALTGIVFTGCHDKKDIEEQRYSWSTDAPLSMPYRVRIQRFDKGNLLRNHSFEAGRTFRLDSLNTSFALDGWHLVGQQVQWTDISNDSLFARDEAYSGNRAIKVVRSRVLETEDKGEGILSEFIRVIPGNYRLSMYLRMEDVYPAKARLGTRMYDGVDISILFYDKNKNRMKASTPFLQDNQEIDASFKALSFAHYRSIPRFGWGKVIGKSNSYPFPEGDIPSDAHYAKVFIGLKGKGTLWIDSVDFRFTGANFSVGERMMKYTDTAFHTPTALIPAPKMMIRMPSVLYYLPGFLPEQLPCIIADPSLSKDEMKSVSLIREGLQKKIAESTSGPVPVIQISESTGDLGKSKLVISIGKNSLYRKYIKELPVEEIQDKPQGYFIYTSPELDNTVFVDAGSSMGLHYAALTFVQMIDNKSATFHNYRIIDYPDFENRYYTIEGSASRDLKSQVAIIGQAVKYKLNGAAVLGSENEMIIDRYPSDHFKLIYLNAFKTPEQNTLTYKYPLALKDTMPDSHADLWVPLVFHNQMLDNSNYEDVFGHEKKASERYVYAGSAYFSLNTDMADIERFTGIMGQNPVFMDNSMRTTESWQRFGRSRYYYPGKLRLYNLFEPYMNNEIKEYFQYFDTTMFIINQPAYSAIENIRLATAAEFMWNASDYDPEYALWKVLVSSYGVENARDLILYADKFSVLLEVLLKLDMNMQTARSIKDGQQAMVDITNLLGSISVRLGSQNDLVKELQKINADLRNRINQKTAQLGNIKK